VDELNQPAGPLPFESVFVTAPYQRRCEDRVAIFEQGERLVIVVADGAGGSGFGAEAAETVIRELRAAYPQVQTSEGWSALLTQTDFRIGAGESTVVVVDVRPSGLCGASVGDSQAWLISDGELTSLTQHQHRKPLLGTGNAVPVGFSAPPLAGILLVATDGFCNYVRRPKLMDIIHRAEFVELPRKLLELVRLKSGELWDDATIALCRKRPIRRPRSHRF